MKHYLCAALLSAGLCLGLAGCPNPNMPNCENPPMNCTAQLTPIGDASSGPGHITITCESIGNGAYSVSFTAAPATPSSPPDAGTVGMLGGPPDGPWVEWTDPPNTPFTFDDTQLVFPNLDEDNQYFKGCMYPCGGTQVCYNEADCEILATYVQVCAVPGSGQSGVCGNTGEEITPACVEVQVTQ